MASEFEQLAREYTTKPSGGSTLPAAMVDGYGPVPGSRSLFNPFNIFRYSRYGLNAQDYKIELHRDSSAIGADLQPALAGVSSADVFDTNKSGVDSMLDASDKLNDVAKTYKALDIRRDFIENPTASQIIEWAKLRSKPGEITAEGPTPYATTDFLWCKYYGKIANNRLVTLRRYPIPVEDNLNIIGSKMPLVPTAQAVTWFDKSTGNSLNQIVKPSWGLKWTPKDIKEMQDIHGNEITVEDLAAATGNANLSPEVIATIKALITGDGNVDIAKLSGFDKTIQEYIGNAYSGKGPYWNRILGPLNVINDTYIRDRGFKDMKSDTISLKFNYSLRSWGGINPRIAFLDLLGNFLSLTYNTAPYWGGGARYFERTGVTLPSLRMEQKFFEGDIFGGVQVGMKELMNLATTRFNTIVSAAKDLVSAGKGRAAGTDTDFNSTDPEGFKKRKELDENAVISTIEKAFIPRLALLMQKPLLFRSILDGRAVGEWHLTVGNPMNPIANIGNLVCTGCTYELGDTLGLDDFPTEVTFTVSLQMARTRAKQDIESMFNLGNGAMTFSELPLPSSALNSFGENVNARLEALRNNQSVEQLTSSNEAGNTAFVSVTNTVTDRNENLYSTRSGNQVSYGSQAGGANTVGNSGSNIAFGGGGGSAADVATKVKTYSSQVRRLWGDGFADSAILTDYFTELKTKD